VALLPWGMLKRDLPQGQLVSPGAVLHGPGLGSQHHEKNRVIGHLLTTPSRREQESRDVRSGFSG
jgi:hypothetical protein